ncbi:exocyst complex component EXO70B1-like [Phalaenopsis equestris]|uniref:exocyst complex component EXO70B1-like n=1 Tax=Phalaenopsis equestris TaxID=78828 RepID=UPI0009E24989|nr:exocyst complex component EXO70B1-like [Phalaenopsis equestris]
MDGSVVAGGPSPPPPPVAELGDTDNLILHWDPTVLPSCNEMVFDGNYSTHAVRNSVAGTRFSHKKSPSQAITVVQLEDEFRHMLVSRANNYEINSLVDLGSLSLTHSNSDAEDEKYQLQRAEGSSSDQFTSYRSTSSIHVIDLLPPDAVNNLRSIADRMIAAGYGRECFQLYGSVRKSVLELCFLHLGIERLRICDVQRLEWDALESKIRRWIRTARVCFRIIFASERRLCDLLFKGLSGDETPFVESVKGLAIQLLSFAEAISIGRRSPEKLFKVLDLHDALTDLLPDIAIIFRSRGSESINTQVVEIIARLAQAVRGILLEFENAILKEPSKIPVPGGTIHPLTRYVMNYIGLISDYKQTLFQLINSRPTLLLGNGFGGDFPDIELPEPLNQSPLAFHLIWIIFILQFNIEIKAQVYKDDSLSHLFLTNNLHYIVQKIKGSTELKELIGDDYPRKLTAKFRQLATGYERTTWLKILYCLRDEGLHTGGSLSSSVSKSSLRERFKAFNAAFEEVHRTQSLWCVPDSQLREELKISILGKLLPAYRSFLGRFRSEIESRRHPEMYLKYSTEDLEIALADFFEGCQPRPLGRRKSR